MASTQNADTESAATTWWMGPKGWETGGGIGARFTGARGPAEVAQAASARETGERSSPAGARPMHRTDRRAWHVVWTGKKWGVRQTGREACWLTFTGKEQAVMAGRAVAYDRHDRLVIHDRAGEVLHTEYPVDMLDIAVLEKNRGRGWETYWYIGLGRAPAESWSEDLVGIEGLRIRYLMEGTDGAR